MFETIRAAESSYLLMLDEHRSRKGVEWYISVNKNVVHNAQRFSSLHEVVLGSANTTHFLYACDQWVNKTFQGTVRRTREAPCKEAITDTRSTQIKLMYGVQAYRIITPSTMTASWCKTGLWRMDFKFAGRWSSWKDELSKERDNAKQRLNASGRRRLLHPFT